MLSCWYRFTKYHATRPTKHMSICTHGVAILASTYCTLYLVHGTILLAGALLASTHAPISYCLYSVQDATVAHTGSSRIRGVLEESFWPTGSGFGPE